MPERAIVPRFSITSARLIPIPLSAIVIVRCARSQSMRMRRSGIVRPGARLAGRFEAQLVARIRSVRHQLAQEYLFVGIKRVDHEVQQALHLGLESSESAGPRSSLADDTAARCGQTFSLMRAALPVRSRR